MNAAQETTKQTQSKSNIQYCASRHDSIEHYLENNNDPRTLTAKHFYEIFSSGTIKLYKTTRAGATTALCSGSVKRKELFTLICRTNRTVTKTVKEGTERVIGYPVNVIHILRNSFCPRIVERIKKHPCIEKFGFIPLPNCDYCEVRECPIRTAYESPISEIHGFSLTYAKLQSLVMSESKKTKILLDKITNHSKNIIFDEIQTLQEGTTVSVPIWENSRGKEWALTLKHFAELKKSSSLMQTFLDKVSEILSAVELEVQKLKNKSDKDHHLKHLASIVRNPASIRNIEKNKKIQDQQKAEKQRIENEYEKAKAPDPNVGYIEVALRNDETTNQSVNKGISELGREDLAFGTITRIQEILIKAIEKPKEYKLKEDEIILLSKLLMIVNSEFFTVSYVRGLDSERITLQAQDTLLFEAIKNFIRKSQNNSNKKRIIFTTATFGSLKIDNLLGLTDVKDWIWGDPLNTSAKLLVIADKSKISPFNFFNRLEAIAKLITEVIGKFGQENVAVCTMNKKWSKALSELGIKSTYYQSDETEGVASNKRIWIFVGLAQKPVNAKDHLAIIQAPYHDNPANLSKEDFLFYVSQKLRLESVHINSYQAISRAKDPEAKDRSVAIMIGVRKEDVEKCLIWSPTRQLKTLKTEKGLKFKVEAENPIGKPLLTVAPLNSDLDESLFIIDNWITNGVVDSYQLNWEYLKRIVDAKGYVSIKRLINVNGLAEQEVRKFFAELTEFLQRKTITDYVLMHDSKGEVKGLASRLFYEKSGKPCIIYNGFTQSSIEPTNADWFLALLAAVERADLEQSELSATYFSHHVSANVYRNLSNFFDSLQSHPQLCLGWIVIGEKGKHREERRLIRDIHCLGAWSPSFPRRVCKNQFTIENMIQLNGYANGASSKNDFFISVYSFPDKHPREGGNPPIDTLFIDLDVESERFSELRKAWASGDNSVLSELLSLRTKLLDETLKQTRLLFDYLVSLKIQPRILLSGFKGVHLFIDFPALQFSSLEVAKKILSKFMDELKSATRVTFDHSVVGDVSRLCRIPNTIHFDSSKLLGRSQYATPITSAELMNLSAEDYDRYCSNQRHLPIGRYESTEMLSILTQIEQDMDLDEVAVSPVHQIKDSERIRVYERECEREILANDDYDQLDIRPCFKRVHREQIQLSGGYGHKLRIGAVLELARQGLSVQSIVRWFSFCDDYDPRITEKAVFDLISRGYTDKHIDEYGSERRKGFKCETIQRCGFCLNESCQIYLKKYGGGDKNWKL